MDLETFEVNQMSRALQSICGVNPFTHHNSASRIQMNGSHMGQKLVIKGATEQMISTGMDKEFGKYTLSVEYAVRWHHHRRVDQVPWVGLVRKASSAIPKRFCSMNEKTTRKRLGSSLYLRTHLFTHTWVLSTRLTNVLKMMKIGDRIEEGTKLLDSSSSWHQW